MTQGQDKTARKGSLLRIDSGAYSDYYVSGFFAVLEDFDPDQEFQKFDKTAPKHEWGWKDLFVDHLIKGGFLRHIDHDTLYMGAYSFDLPEFKPHNTDKTSSSAPTAGGK
jgi:hypothetical protein